MTIRAAFSFGVEIAGLDRLVLIHKVSLIMPLPVSYQERLQATAGRRRWSRTTPGSAASTRIPSNFFAQIAVEPEPFLKIYPEFKLPPEQMKAWLGRSAGRHRRRRSREALRLEDRRSHPAPGTIWQPKQGADLGVQHRRHLRRRAGRRQDAVLLPLRLPRREPPRRRGPGRLVRREDRRPVAGAGDGREVRRACSRTRRPRPRPRPRRASSKASPSRSATSARS